MCKKQKKKFGVFKAKDKACRKTGAYGRLSRTPVRVCRNPLVTVRKVWLRVWPRRQNKALAAPIKTAPYMHRVNEHAQAPARGCKVIRFKGVETMPIEMPRVQP